MCNYVSLIGLLHEAESVESSTVPNITMKETKTNEAQHQPQQHEQKRRKVIGAVLRDEMTGEEFEVRTKVVLGCAGPFADELYRQDKQLAEHDVLPQNREQTFAGASSSATSVSSSEQPQLPQDASTTATPKPIAKPKRIINGVGGAHVVLPSYYAPAGIGLVDMSTSDGRFLFFLPWEGNVLVGTTDLPMEPSMRPVPSETEIRWLLREAAKYLSPELKVRRKDVLSAWSGVRPIVTEDAAELLGITQREPSGSISRDFVVHRDRQSDIIYLLGGKWTTYREM